MCGRDRDNQRIHITIHQSDILDVSGVRWRFGVVAALTGRTGIGVDWDWEESIIKNVTGHTFGR